MHADEGTGAEECRLSDSGNPLWPFGFRVIE
jgi:hypothetical protein